ncbi:MAG: hypothetical protein AAF722_06700 [Cyanobacteria bacterium P01_C01_bin.70]
MMKTDFDDTAGDREDNYAVSQQSPAMAPTRTWFKDSTGLAEGQTLRPKTNIQTLKSN